MRILAIDPGTTRSGFVLYCHAYREVEDCGTVENERMLRRIRSLENPTMIIPVIEMVACYGMAVGREVFEACVWIGRFEQAFFELSRPVEKLYRRDVKMHLCNSVRAKDANVRQALIDKFPSSGGGKCQTIGTKAEPGPLYGMSGDAWAALGVAVTYAETFSTK